MCGTDAAAGWQTFDTRTPPSAASKWVNFNDMTAWYWFEAKFNADICEMDAYWGMGTTFQALKVNPKYNKAETGLQCFQIRHQNENAKYPNGKLRPPLEQSYTVDGKLYHTTNAEHFFAMDTRAGAIVGHAAEPSPIGATIGFLLMQHKKDLGNKYISSVRVLRNDRIQGDTHDEVDLVFHIEDVPPERRVTDEPLDVDPSQVGTQINALAVANLIPRNDVVYPVAEQVLGSNNILRIHRIEAH
ncbi:hypothetical protein E8E12_003225 [Didymella heteroderae]|uniref:Uncharacterized protein n=1 Tax=Didymella heteroderae TaxID=1769908 RepID=A0A9P5C1V6_9PLEO|nr:hypothetical protein E8E12_003225 [Didymella heteroderae]